MFPCFPFLLLPLHHSWGSLVSFLLSAHPILFFFEILLHPPPKKNETTSLQKYTFMRNHHHHLGNLQKFCWHNISQTLTQEIVDVQSKQSPNYDFDWYFSSNLYEPVSRDLASRIKLYECTNLYLQDLFWLVWM